MSEELQLDGSWLVSTSNARSDCITDESENKIFKI